MGRSLRWRLLVGPVAVLVCAVALALVLVLRSVGDAMQDLSQAHASLILEQRTARLVRVWEGGGPQAARARRRLATLAGADAGDVEFLPVGQAVGGASRAVPLGIGSLPAQETLHALPATARLALSEGERWRATADGERVVVDAAPAVWEGQVQGAALLLHPARGGSLAGALAFNLGEAGLTVLLLGAVLWWLQARRMAAPLARLTAMARRLERGDFGVRADSVHGPREYTELAHALAAMAQNLERTEIARREFLATVSHELRTPLTALTGYLQALGDGTVPPERADVYREKCLDEVSRLSRLLDDLLDMAKAEAGRLELAVRPVSLRETVARAVLLWEHAIRQKGLSMHVDMPDDPVEAEVDPDRVLQIVSNLLSNAVHATPPGGELRVSLAWQGAATDRDAALAMSAPALAQGDPAKDPGAMAVIEVADTGPPFPADILPRLGDRNARWLPSGQARGTGLGLVIVRTLAAAHGGDVRASAEHGWTRVRVRLPRRFAPEGGCEPKLAPGSAQRPPTQGEPAG